MPLVKRILFSPESFQHAEQFIEVDGDTNIQEVTYSKLLGSIRQLAYLSSYSLEIFKSLAVLAEDVNERTKILSRRTDLAIHKLVELDRGIRATAMQPDLQANRLTKRYFNKGREMSTPPIFVKTTNYSSVLSQYRACRTAPQLWRIENVIGEDCFKFYSYPGFFFEEWLKSEIIRQEISKAQRKLDKALRKQQKKERRKLQREQLALSLRKNSTDFHNTPDNFRPKSLLTKEIKDFQSKFDRISLEENEKINASASEVNYDKLHSEVTSFSKFKIFLRSCVLCY
jgi:hypothetical protein